MRRDPTLTVCGGSQIGLTPAKGADEIAWARISIMAEGSAARQASASPRTPNRMAMKHNHSREGTCYARNSSCGAVVGAALVARLGSRRRCTAQDKRPIRIGLLPPITGPLASPGAEMVNGFRLFWEQAGITAGGRKVEIVTGDTTCNPDQALTQARRLVLQEKVHFLVGPLCGHEGPAVAQVSKETGVPLVMDAAGADNVTKWDRTPTVVRTAISSSQIGHPFGEYLYKELGLRNVTFIGQDYTFGHEVTLGAIKTFTDARRQGRAADLEPDRHQGLRHHLNPSRPTPTASSLIVVGADRIRLFEDWFNFGMDKKHKIYGSYWLQEDMLPQVDDRAVGLIGNSLHYAAGHRHAGEQGLRRRLSPRNTSGCRPGSPSPPTRRACGPRRRSTRSTAMSRTATRSSRRCAPSTIKAPRGPLKLDAYDNPIQNVYISQDREDKAPGARRRADQQADQDLRGGVAVLDLEAGGVPQARALQALTALDTRRRAGDRRRTALSLA